MRSLLHTLVLASAALAASFGTSAAMAATILTVPFDFTVAGHRCPAGDYSIQRDSISNLVILQSRKQSETFKWLAGPGNPAPTDTRIGLTFAKTTDIPALRYVQYGPIITHRLDKTNSKEEFKTTAPMKGQ